MCRLGLRFEGLGQISLRENGRRVKRREVLKRAEEGCRYLRMSREGNASKQTVLKIIEKLGRGTLKN